MSEHDFQVEVLERITQVNERLNETMRLVHNLEKRFQETQKTAIIASQSSKSAHHRISTMYCIAGAIGAVVSFVVDFFRR